MSGQRVSAGTKSDVLDVAIIGAGPAGLALAGMYFCRRDSCTQSCGSELGADLGYNISGYQS